jgi:hypothetical protein
MMRFGVWGFTVVGALHSGRFPREQFALVRQPNLLVRKMDRGGA